MKDQLPPHHGLPDDVIATLVFRDGDAFSITDVQFEALSAGVGKGESVLVVSPTSTGKTQVALWGMVTGLSGGKPVVYLVTHRALARQKFEDFQRSLLLPFLANDGSALVMATGDEVVDATGSSRTDPLSARLLVATYEKYLALLCSAGLPRTARRAVIVCDEIQLVGDLHRGRDVEILLTLIRNAGCGQFIGLSAVLQRRDAEALAEWLNVSLVHQPQREKHLQYECWTPDRMLVARSEYAEAAPEERAVPGGVWPDAVAVLQHVLNDREAQKPVIVFCMRKADTYGLAQRFVGLRQARSRSTPEGQLPLAFDELPETAANVLLAKILRGGVAVHSADLTEAERAIVEGMLLQRRIDVVFATSTLAAGVHFPFGTAIFADWQRWDSARGARTPIEHGDFHNMAGRVGRMGYEHGLGRVIFMAGPDTLSIARTYLALDNLTPLEPRIDPDRFGQIALQLVSSQLCASRGEVETVIFGTFSGSREAARNRTGLAHWKSALSESIDDLVHEGLLAEANHGPLVATPFGKAVAQSGLLPETGVHMLRFLAEQAVALAMLLPSKASVGDVDRLALVLFATCLKSPEFRPLGGRSPTRFLPYPLAKRGLATAADFGGFVSARELAADSPPHNGAKLSLDWIHGEALRSLEDRLPDLSAGMLRDLFRDLAWCLHGMAAIAVAAADGRVLPAERPRALVEQPATLRALSKLPRMMRRFCARIAEGLPDDVLWLPQVPKANPTYRLTRSEILALRAEGLSTPERMMLGSADADSARCRVFAKAKPAAKVKANWLRDACRDWKGAIRRQACERQMRRAARCPQVDLVARFHAAVGDDFEEAFEEALQTVGIAFERLDDGKRTGAPDYLVRLSGSPPLVVELKSKLGANLVPYNSAVEVLSASEVHGYKDASCVTLCHPGVDPAVAPVIAECARLCVVESGDFAEALLRHCEGHLTQPELWQWLASPGQALVSDLFYSSVRSRSGYIEHSQT
ncbi:MAG: DEAD/DEAH box helicase [Vicinamibacterales bacterium]